MATARGAALVIEVPKIDVRQMEITLIGDSPLIIHKWSDKAKQMMLDKQMKVAKPGKDAKNPEQDYLDSLYIIPNESLGEAFAEAGVEPPVRYGFPCVGFKAAAVSACRFSDGVKMTEARGAFHVVGEYAWIEGEPRMREDMVRIAMGTADIRYRGEFTDWKTTLTISYNAAALSPAQIVNLFNIAGFGVGVGEWRPEKDGQYGRFHVATGSD